MRYLKVSSLLLIFVLINWIEFGTATFGVNHKKLREFLDSVPDLWDKRELSDTDLAYFKHRLGGLSPEEKAKRKSKATHKNVQQRVFTPTLETVPEVDNEHLEEWEKLDHFDAREQWPGCHSIREIQDQSRCGSCWAVATAAVFSDRICIATNGRQQPRISAIDLARCCLECHSDGHMGNGCEGGVPLDAFKYIARSGVVTGGAYKSGQGCLPYPFPPTMLHLNQKSGDCVETCENTAFNYRGDRRFTKFDDQTDLEYIKGERNMMRELYTRGPITVDIVVRADFLKYWFKKGGDIGVYEVKKILKKPIIPIVGHHSVRVLGWGIDTYKGKKIPYWTIANSWGESWGNKGTFKLLRGENELGVEEFGAAGNYDEIRTNQKRKNRL